MIWFFAACIIAAFAYIPNAHAETPYERYLYLTDVYRNALTDYQRARNEYVSYRSLTTQTTATERGRDLLIARNDVITGYYGVLSELLGGTNGLLADEQASYSASIRRQSSNLTVETLSLRKMTSLAELAASSQSFDTAYPSIRSDMRQIIIGLTVAKLAEHVAAYDVLSQRLDAYIQETSPLYSDATNALIGRWQATTKDKRRIIGEEIASIRATNAAMTTLTNGEEMERSFTSMQNAIDSTARKLAELSSNQAEIIRTMKYAD